MSHTLACDDGTNIGKVAVNHVGLSDNIADTLDALTEDIISDHERFTHGLVADDGEQLLIGDDNERVNDITECANTLYCARHAVFAFEIEGLGDDCNGENTEFLCNLGNDGSCAGTGTAAHAGSYEQKIRTAYSFGQRIAAFLSGCAADFGFSARTEAAGRLFTDLNLYACHGPCKSLSVGIYGNKLDSLQTVFDHAVYGIAACSADTYDLDLGDVPGFIVNLKFECHYHILLRFSNHDFFIGFRGSYTSAVFIQHEFGKR